MSPLRSHETTDIHNRYVVLRFGKEEARSTTIKRNLNPTWNEKMRLWVFADYPPYLEVSVWDQDEAWKKTGDDFLGQVMVPIEAVIRDGFSSDTWLKLQPR